MRYFLFLTLFISCSYDNRKPKDISLNIEMTNSENNEVTLEKVSSNYSIELISSDIIKDDLLKMIVEVKEPTLYRLNIKGAHTIDIILDDNDVNISIEDGSYKVDGSKDTDYLNNIKEYINNYREKVSSLNRDFILANQKSDQKKISLTRIELLESKKSFEKNFKNLLWDLENSLAVLFIADYLKIQDHFNFWDSIIVRYKNDLGYTSYYKDLSKRVEQIKVLSIGQIAPEITLNDIHENPISLSSLRGKYVLLDFWAGWCRPCRVENPNIVKMYRKYNKFGFDVFQVSLDRSRSTWINAIESDNLGAWNHVSDLKFWQSKAAQIYNIKSIPASFFLDPQGKIIAKDLRGSRLEKKLSEIFNQK